jgi:hypothetical protein
MSNRRSVGLGKLGLSQVCCVNNVFLLVYLSCCHVACAHLSPPCALSFVTLLRTFICHVHVHSYHSRSCALTQATSMCNFMSRPYANLSVVFAHGGSRVHFGLLRSVHLHLSLHVHLYMSRSCTLLTATFVGTFLSY